MTGVSVSILASYITRQRAEAVYASYSLYVIKSSTFYLEIEQKTIVCELIRFLF